MKKLVNSVKKALDVLDIMVFDDFDRHGLPLVELSRRSGIPTNTLHALVGTLVACGYVQQNPDSTYRAGKKIDDVGRQNLVRRQLAEKIPKLLEECRDATGESVVFYVLINAEKVPVHAVNRNGLLSIDFNKLRGTAFFATSTSRVIHAFSPPEDREAIVRRWGLPGDSWNDINDESALETAAEAVRNAGFEESVTKGDNLYSVAYPVFDQRGQLFGAVGTYAPVSDVDASRKRQFKRHLRTLVERLETTIRS